MPDKPAKPVRGKPRALSISDGVIETPQQAEFVAELALNGGNATAAARKVGFSESYGRQLASRNAAIRAALDWIKEQNLAKAIGWADLVPLAQQELLDLLASAENEMVKFNAIRLIIEHAEGKPVSRTEALVTHRQDASSVSPETYRWAVNEFVRSGKPLAQLLEEARKNPLLVREWARSHPPRQLPSGLASLTTPDSPPPDLLPPDPIEGERGESSIEGTGDRTGVSHPVSPKVDG
jgi:hypothetical protein